MKVWDLPTRAFHWLIVLLVGVSWWSAEQGAMDWHYRSGLAALTLVVFRVIWGFAGSSTARFDQFLRSPRSAWTYLRQTPRPPLSAGHNPVGGYSVILMLLVLLTQVGTGLFSVDVDGIESGPLSYLVTFDQGRALAEVHELSFSILQILIMLHVAAIVYYRLRGRKLVWPMISGGDKQLPPGTAEMSGGGPIRAALALLAALGFAWWISVGAPV